MTDTGTLDFITVFTVITGSGCIFVGVIDLVFGSTGAGPNHEPAAPTSGTAVTVTVPPASGGGAASHLGANPFCNQSRP